MGGFEAMKLLLMLLLLLLSLSPSSAKAGGLLSPFMKCALQSIQNLDDHISSAQVISDAVVENCRPVIVYPNDCDFNCQGYAVAELKRKMVVYVLKERSSKRNQTQ